MSVVYLLAPVALSAVVVWLSMWAAYRMGYQQGQAEMHWSHFDKGCYLDGNGEVYDHLRGGTK